MIRFNVGYTSSFSVMGRVWLSSVVRANVIFPTKEMVNLYLIVMNMHRVVNIR